jgi:predicted P-loop ATPase
MTPQELLETNGIRLRSYAPGNYSLICPECSPKRSKANQKKECLSVKIDGQGATWYCHHCGWDGPRKGQQRTNGRGGKARLTYVYLAADGTPAFRKVRGFDKKNGQKFFWIERFEPAVGGGWIKGTNDKSGKRLVDTSILYRLPEVIKAIAAGSDIACVEGEKDADRLWSIGIPATCNAHGAADPLKNQKPKWKREHSEQLRGAKIVVIPDHDNAGYAHADTTCKLSLGVAKRVRKLVLAEHWSDILKGGDSSDYLDAGHTPEEFKALFEKAPEYEPPPAPASPPLKPGEEETEYMLKFSDLACNVGNVIRALEHEPELTNAFAYDEMLRAEVLLRPLFRAEPNFQQRPVTDADVTAVQTWLQWKGFRKLGPGAAHEAVNKHARDHAFHPVRDYLNALNWDGKPRVSTWLTTYAGAPSTMTNDETGYVEEIGKMFLIGMVARALQPGCKLDYMLILEGIQGTQRSTFCTILAGDYFSDQLPKIASKECSQHLRGKWLIEVPERPLRDATVDEFKEFLTRQVERYRPPWGKKEVHEPRQCVFIATTNKDIYLRDETGNRRFWPVKTGDLDLDALRQDRDQLFAEAVQLYHGGVHWWPDADFEQQHIVPEQENRYEQDVWEPLIRDYLDILHVPKRTSILHIAVNVLGYETEPPLIQPQGQPQEPRKTPINRFGTAEQRRVTAILRHLGWLAKRDKRERWWEPGPNPKTR